MRNGIRRTLLFAASVLSALVLYSAAAAGRYVVLYGAEAVPSDARASIAAARGKVVASYPRIGVVIASSTSRSFRTRLLLDGRIEGVAQTAAFASRLPFRQTSRAASAARRHARVLASGDALSSLQWDMTQVHAFEAHDVTLGSRSVVVGDLDSGIDPTHPDLAANVDAANSASCVTGAPDQHPDAWFDNNGHGTHTAGIIAAAANGIGIVGVAPNVRIAAVKVGNDEGLSSLKP